MALEKVMNERREATRIHFVNLLERFLVDGEGGLFILLSVMNQGYIFPFFFVVVSVRLYESIFWALRDEWRVEWEEVGWRNNKKKKKGGRSEVREWRWRWRKSGSRGEGAKEDRTNSERDSEEEEKREDDKKEREG
jgi:hypothetical protein